MPGNTLCALDASRLFPPGFNEAPAKCRGILCPPVDFRSAGGASMRPQRNAGEYPGGPIADSPGSTRFNEAPAKCRGILPLFFQYFPFLKPLQ